MLNQNCPSCGAFAETRTVSRSDLITMQNYIYRNFDAAAKAAVGHFELCFCRRCGLAFNAAFDGRLMNYDEGYTAYIPSAVFDDYYREIAVFLHERFALDDGLAVDIACGKGNFLEVLCRMFPKVRGLGIDPSYEFASAPSSTAGLELVKDVFKEEYVTEKPALVLCRHAFDQIENPLDFLKSIRRSLANYNAVPFFIEVGDLEWMVENESFTDFCYERCSFFTTDSLKNILRLAGFTVEKIEKAFGGQYLWAFGTIQTATETISADDLNFIDENAVGEKLLDYSAAEKNLIAAMKAKLNELKAQNAALAVWGMATKGVVFCNLIDAERKLFDYCIDINPQKIGCFVPHTGHQINAPEILREAADTKLSLVVMNPNYLREVAAECRKLHLNAAFLDTNGRPMSVK